MTRLAGTRVLVWDRLQRVLHWVLVVAIAMCWFFGEARLAVHEAAGYVALAVCVVRGVWGFAGSAHARFSSFVLVPSRTWAYARSLAGGRAVRHLGHNPLGGWMIVAMLLCLLVVCASGIAYTTDRFWGLAWVEATHRLSAWALIGMAALHVVGVAVMSWRHRENLVRSMIDGRKRPQ